MYLKPFALLFVYFSSSIADLQPLFLQDNLACQIIQLSESSSFVSSSIYTKNWLLFQPKKLLIQVWTSMAVRPLIHINSLSPQKNLSDLHYYRTIAQLKVSWYSTSVPYNYISLNSGAGDAITELYTVITTNGRVPAIVHVKEDGSGGLWATMPTAPVIIPGLPALTRLLLDRVSSRICIVMSSLSWAEVWWVHCGGRYTMPNKRLRSPSRGCWCVKDCGLEPVLYCWFWEAAWELYRGCDFL